MKTAQKQCRDEKQMIGQLDCARLAVRPNRRHFKGTVHQFPPLVRRQSVATAKWLLASASLAAQCDGEAGSNSPMIAMRKKFFIGPPVLSVEAKDFNVSK